MNRRPAVADVRQEDPLPLAVEGPTSRRVSAYGELTGTAQVVACRPMPMYSDPAHLGLARCKVQVGAAGGSQPSEPDPGPLDPGLPSF